MKNVISVTALISALAALSSPVSGSIIQSESDGYLELPVFSVYAVDSAVAGETSTPLSPISLQFRPVVDADAEPVLIKVKTPGGEIQSIPTPAIGMALVNREESKDTADNS